MMWSKSLAALLLFLSSMSDAACPVLRQGSAGGITMGANPHTEEGRRFLAKLRRLEQRPEERKGDVGIPDGGFAAVRESIKEVLVNSQDFFPADFEPPIGPNYGGKENYYMALV